MASPQETMPVPIVNSLIDAAEAVRELGLNGLRLDGSTDTCGTVHVLNSVNVARVRQRFQTAMRSLKLVAQSHQAWSGEASSDRLRRIKSDLAQANQTLEKLQKSLGDAAATCAREDAMAPPGFRLSCALRQAGQRAGADCFEEEVAMDVDALSNGGAADRAPAAQTASQLTICGRTFLADVRFQARERRAKVFFRHLIGDSEQPDAAADSDIEYLLDSGRIDEVERAFKTLIDIERLEDRVQGAPIKAALRGLEDDLLCMRQHEVQAGYSAAQRVSYGMGLLRRSACGVRIHYYASAGTLLRLQASPSAVQDAEHNALLAASSDSLHNVGDDVRFDGELDNVRTLLLGAEDAPRPGQIVSGSQRVGVANFVAGGGIDGETDDNNLPLRFTFGPDSSMRTEAVFVLRVEPPLACSAQQAALLTTPLLRCSEDGADAADSAEEGAEAEAKARGAPGGEAKAAENGAVVGDGLVRLQHLLAGDVFGADAGDVELHVPLAESSMAAFSHSADDQVPGATVSRVPVRHPRDVQRMLELLRQQALFNDLFVSCFRKAKQSMESTEGASVLPVEVVTSEPPSFLQFNVGEATQGYVAGSVAVHISLGGRLQAKVSGFNSAWTSPDETFTQLLVVSRNVPEALHLLLQSSAKPDESMAS